MSNQLYTPAKTAFLLAQIRLLQSSIRVALIDTAQYAFESGDQFLDDIPITARVAVSSPLTGMTLNGGVFDADDITIPAVTGPTVSALVLYIDSGNDANSRLIAYIDTWSSGAPIIPNGGDVMIRWPSGSDKIFRLASDTFFRPALDHILVGNIDLASEDIRVVLVDTNQYTVDLDSDQYLVNIPSGARVTTSSQGLTGKSVVDGAFDADDHTIPEVLGASVEAYALYLWTEDISTSPLIAYFDTATTGLPLIPNGGDVVVQWSNENDKILRIV